MACWGNEKYVELVKQAYAEPDEAKRNQYLMDAEEILMEEMPVTGVYSSVNSWVQRSRRHRWLAQSFDYGRRIL